MNAVPLPDRIQVRLSSENAGAISMTPVLHQSIPVRDLVEMVLATTGKNALRVREVLVRGAVVQGASRFRWEPLDAQPDDIDAVLRTFPNADPQRPFRAESCIAVRMKAGRHAIELPREIGVQRRFLKRRSFWDSLMAQAAASKLDYIDYSYRTRADEYRLSLARSQAAELRADAALLRYSTLAAQVRESALEAVEYLVRFP